MSGKPAPAGGDLASWAGNTNTTTHEIAAHVDLGQPESALTAAETWSPPQTMPKARRGHHYIEPARLVTDSKPHRWMR